MPQLAELNPDAQRLLEEFQQSNVTNAPEIVSPQTGNETVAPMSGATVKLEDGQRVAIIQKTYKNGRTHLYEAVVHTEEDADGVSHDVVDMHLKHLTIDDVVRGHDGNGETYAAFKADENAKKKAKRAQTKRQSPVVHTSEDLDDDIVAGAPAAAALPVPHTSVKITKLPYPGRGLTPTTWDGLTPEQQGRWLKNTERPETISQATWNGWTPEQQALYRANASAPERPSTITEATWNGWTPDQRVRYVHNSAAAAGQSNVKPPEALSYKGKHRRLERAGKAMGIIVRHSTRPDGGEKREVTLGWRAAVAAAMIGVVALAGTVGARKLSEGDTAPKAQSVATASSTVDHMESKKKDGTDDGKDKPLQFSVHQDDRPWDTLQHAGVPAGQIMHDLDQAAKKSGLDYEWHGSGKHRWIEVEGKSDTPSIIHLLGKYIKK